jgi:5,10-methylenetetrahydromethanopterin reductase
MGQIGARPASPLTLLREYSQALRALLAGESVTTDGDYVHLDRVRLRWPAADPAPLVIGGVGPKTLRLAAELGDGTMFTSALSEQQMRESAELVRGATDDPDHRIVAHLMVARGADADARLAADLAASWPGASPEGGVAGDAGDVAAAIDRLAAIGITTVLVHPIADETDPVDFVRWLGSEVGPQVSSRG